MAILKPLLAWSVALVLGWFLWRYLKTGVAYTKAGRYERRSGPIGYWFAMAVNVFLVAFVTALAIAVTMEALGL